jgi:hypothetical protein
MAENRSEFQRLARMRLRDARILLANGNAEAAYYLTGLAVECALKACIAKNTQRHDFPPNQNAIKDIYNHDLDRLMAAARLKSAFDAEKTNNLSLRNKWDVVKDWNVNCRYATGGLNAEDLYRAAAGRNGVMQWLRQRW